MNSKYIGRRIRQLRIKAKLTQSQLAEKVDISTNYLSILERGVKCPKLETFIKIVIALDVTADDLLMDLIPKDITLKSNRIAESFQGLTLLQIQMIYDVIETMAENFQQQNHFES